MNEEEKKALEAKNQAGATGQGQETATATTQDKDDTLLTLLEQKDKEMDKIRQERDNYRRGMLKAKGKDSTDDEPEELSIAEQVQQAVREALMDSEYQRIQKEKDEIVKQALRENAELKTALTNRAQVGQGNAQGNSTETVVPKDNFLSEQQIAYFKSIGKDDAWIERYKKTAAKNKGF